jgi:hypothetical protein
MLRLNRYSMRTLQPMLLLTASLVINQAASGATETTLENFEQYRDGDFPANWRARNKEAKNIYRVESEGNNRFLRAHADKQGLQIALERAIDPRRHPRLRWRWRVRRFPDSADERLAEKHDAAAQVYVVFDNSFWPRVIKYIWSETVPAGARFAHPLYSRGYFVVQRSGALGVGTWRQEEINFFEDYKRFFGAEPGTVQGIAIITSADSTRSQASADYDDFVLP